MLITVSGTLDSSPSVITARFPVEVSTQIPGGRCFKHVKIRTNLMSDNQIYFVNYTKKV